jgi:Protein tyrosine and serine/threonine kinase
VTWLPEIALSVQKTSSKLQTLDSPGTRNLTHCHHLWSSKSRPGHFIKSNLDFAGMCWMISTRALAAPSSLSSGHHLRCSTIPVSPANLTSGHMVRAAEIFVRLRRTYYAFVAGVLMWEVFTCGKMPYGRLKNTEVVDRVQRGIVLEKPKACFKEVYDVRDSFYRSFFSSKIHTRKLLLDFSTYLTKTHI